MNNKLIQELREGKVAVTNDGSLNDLNKVLKYAFPEDLITSGVNKFYKINSGKSYYWGGVNKTDLPSYSVKDFLKEETMEKKIIGYKLIKPEYKKAAQEIIGLRVNWEIGKSFTEVMENKPSSYYIEKLTEVGVLDLWFEPIYEEEIKLPTINTYEGEIVGKTIKYGCAILNITMLKKVLETTRIVSPDGAGNRSIKAIVLDSGVEISIKDIEQIKKYLDAKGI